MMVLDLFSGIGGFSLGLERAGMETVAFCEYDEKCRKVLKKHWPHVPQYNDVRELTAEQLKNDGITVGVICGGFPCQDISWSWPGKGLRGQRSGLWLEYHRLIHEIKPQYAVIENVGNLRSKGLAEIIKSLAAIGYDCEWQTISASDAGAPHKRDRVWIIAYRNWTPVVCASDCIVCDCCEEPFCLKCSDHYSDCACPGPHSEECDGWRVEEEDWGLVAYSDLSGRKEQRWAGAISAQYIANELYSGWEVIPDFLRVDDGFPGRVDSIKQLGNAVVPQIPEIIGRAIMGAEA